ncbi:MAG: small-conductance mechanosensitive ion channel [Pseudomonadota bacterium]|nr:small-conductance mechanosensitive ion channel [Pseudomonadota bacterium]
MPVVVNDWSEAMMTSLAGAMAMFFSAIPRVIGFVLIVVIGWFIASLIGKGISALLHAVNFNGLAERAGFASFVKKMGVKTDASGFLAEIGKWFIRLIVLVVAFDALGLPAVSDVLRQLLLWLPNLVVAMVVLIIGGLVAKAASSLVRGATSEAGFDNPERLAKIAGAMVWAFAIVIAVNQIGIAATLVNTLFMGFIGALALALGLAFGLGGRETAAEIVQNWYEKGKEAAPKVGEATDRAAERVKQEASKELPRSTPGPYGQPR